MLISNKRINKVTYQSSFFKLLGLMILAVILLLIASHFESVGVHGPRNPTFIYGLLAVVLFVYSSVWQVMIAAYRLRDTGHSGLWAIIIIIIPINFLLAAYLMTKQSQQRSNKWGNVPPQTRQGLSTTAPFKTAINKSADFLIRH